MNSSKINEKIIEILEHVRDNESSLSGDSFDHEVFNILHEKFPNIISLSKTDNYFLEIRKKSLKGNYNFSDFLPLDNIYIMPQPNGSQKWPDILIIANGIGLPVEIKSCKDDRILWNSGYPKPNSLYIFNWYTKKVATFFLGQHVITEEELQVLQDGWTKLKTLKYKKGRWNLFPRVMNVSSEKLFVNKNEVLKRQTETIDFVRNLTWDNNQTHIFPK